MSKIRKPILSTDIYITAHTHINNMRVHRPQLQLYIIYIPIIITATAEILFS